MFRSPFLILTLFTALAALVLVSCKPDATPRAQQALDWANKFYTRYQLRGGWFFFGAEAQGDNVVVFINVPQTQARQLQQLDEDKEINLITQVTCPPRNEDIWSILDLNGDVIIQPRLDGNPFAKISCKTRKKVAS